MSLPINDQLRHTIGYGIVSLGCRVAKGKGRFPILKPINPIDVELLENSAFQASVREVQDLTFLDTPRLANLWNLCRMTDPQGNILEIGSYKGGGALHLSNCCPDRKVIVCDPFGGFETLDPKLDHNFATYMFKDNLKEDVEGLFKSRGRPHDVIPGYFPASCRGRDLGRISFVHLDADIYKATIESLNYLQKEGCLLDNSFIVLDDFSRRADGVNQAVSEFTNANKDWIAIPMFPAQAVMLRRSWFGS